MVINDSLVMGSPVNQSQPVYCAGQDILACTVYQSVAFNHNLLQVLIRESFFNLQARLWTPILQPNHHVTMFPYMSMVCY